MAAQFITIREGGMGQARGPPPQQHQGYPQGQGQFAGNMHPQAMHQQNGVPPPLPLHMVPDNMRQPSLVENSDIRNEQRTNASKAEELSSYQVFRFEKVQGENEFDEEGNLLLPSWYNVRRYKIPGMSKPDIVRVVRKLNEEEGYVAEKKEKLFDAQKRQLEKTLDELTRREPDQRYCYVLAQFDQQFEKLERRRDGYYDKNNQLIVADEPKKSGGKYKEKEREREKEDRKRRNSNSWYRSDPKDGKKHKSKKKTTVSITAYFKRTPKDEANIDAMYYEYKQNVSNNASNAPPNFRPGQNGMPYPQQNHPQNFPPQHSQMQGGMGHHPQMQQHQQIPVPPPMPMQQRPRTPQAPQQQRALPPPIIKQDDGRGGAKPQKLNKPHTVAQKVKVVKMPAGNRRNKSRGRYHESSSRSSSSSIVDSDWSDDEHTAPSSIEDSSDYNGKRGRGGPQVRARSRSRSQHRGPSATRFHQKPTNHKAYGIGGNKQTLVPNSAWPMGKNSQFMIPVPAPPTTMANPPPPPPPPSTINSSTFFKEKQAYTLGKLEGERETEKRFREDARANEMRRQDAARSRPEIITVQKPRHPLPRGQPPMTVEEASSSLSYEEIRSRLDRLRHDDDDDESIEFEGGYSHNARRMDIPAKGPGVLNRNHRPEVRYPAETWAPRVDDRVPRHYATEGGEVPEGRPQPNPFRPAPQEPRIFRVQRFD